MTKRTVGLAIAMLALFPPIGMAQSAPASAPTVRDGQQDFDFEIGVWKTDVRVLRNPLSGATPDWASYSGVSVVRPVLDGRANLVELAVTGPAGKIEGVSLRLYNAQARQWSLNYGNARGGVLTAPVFGGFDAEGRGSFHGTDTLDGRAIFVRFLVIPETRDRIRFEQAYSADGGATWETNWLATDTRTPG